jgi:hypothetical protein
VQPREVALKYAHTPLCRRAVVSFRFVALLSGLVCAGALALLALSVV